MTTIELDNPSNTNNQPDAFSVAIAQLGLVSLKVKTVQTAMTQAIYGILDDHEGTKLAEEIEQIASLHVLSTDFYAELEAFRLRICETRPDLAAKKQEA